MGWGGYQNQEKEEPDCFVQLSAELERRHVVDVTDAERHHPEDKQAVVDKESVTWKNKFARF